MRYINQQLLEYKLSCICVGTANFGYPTTETDAFAMLNQFVNQGGNFIDTAHVYSDWIPNTQSSSEKVIGKWFNTRKNRNNIYLASKGAHPHLENMKKSRMSQKEITKDIDEGLLYAKTDYFDLIQPY